MNRNAMTPVRACQVASELLRRIESQPLLANGARPMDLTTDDHDAIQVLRDTTAKVIVHGLQRR
jgi:hypothetical protein